MPARRLVDGALMAALTVVLALVAFYVPVLGSILLFVLPAPAAALTVRWGLGIALASIVVAGVTLGLLLGPVQALGLVIVFAFMGLALGWGLRRGWSGGTTILLGAVAALLSVVSALAFSKLFLHEDALTVGLNQTRSLLETMVATGPTYVRDGAQSLLLALDNLATDPLLWVLPGAGALLFLSFLYYAAMTPLLRRLHIQVPALTPFAAWTVPRWMAWAWFFTLLPLLFRLPVQLQWLAQASSLAFYLFLFAFLVIGTSVLYFYLRNWRVSPYLAYPLAILVAVTPFWEPFLALAGVWETLFGLRARVLQKQEPGQGLRAEVGEEASAALLALYRPFLGPPPPKKEAPSRSAEKKDAPAGEKEPRTRLTAGKRRKLRKRKR
ncbi:MAG: YybS family protein [Bacillota bacterium]|nr:YybS family protein [Bacillota bacterium]